MQISEGASYPFKIFPPAKSFNCLPRSICSHFDLHNLTICSLIAPGYQKVVHQYFSNSGIFAHLLFLFLRQYDSAKCLLRIRVKSTATLFYGPGNLKCHTYVPPSMFLHLCLYFRNEELDGRKNSLISNEKPRIRAFSFENDDILMRVGLPFTLVRRAFSSTTHRFQNALGS